jgi:hypothetical protein
MEVSMAVESFTSDKYGVAYHARAPEPVGGLRVTFISVGDFELEFLANLIRDRAGTSIMTARAPHGRTRARSRDMSPRAGAACTTSR